MRIASILCHNLQSTKQCIRQALPFCDVIELRLDYLAKIDLNEIKQLRRGLTKPVMFTLRKQSQGGRCARPEPERTAIIQSLAALAPDYLDLEFDTAAEIVSELKQRQPTVRMIGSYHDFKQTPADLTALFQAINKPYFDIIKIATFANTLSDALRLLIFVQKISHAQQIIGIAMGDDGQVSRIVGPIVGSLMSYGSVAEATAPGQLTLQDMTEIYRVHLLNRETRIAALLGYPVTQSPGHLYHNQVFAQKNQNAVYVKLALAPAMVAEFMPLLKQLPFSYFM